MRFTVQTELELQHLQTDQIGSYSKNKVQKKNKQADKSCKRAGKIKAGFLFI